MGFTISLLFVSCSEQEETPQPESDPVVNQAVFQFTGIPMSHCYLVLDDGPNFTNCFMFVMSDGEYQEDNVNGASFVNTTQNAVSCFVRFPSPAPATVASEQAVDVTPGAYALNDETGAYFGINAWDDTYTQNGNTYGEPDGANHIIEQGLNGGGVLVINSVTIDYSARTGTIDADYQMLDGNRNYISGTYSGTFEILNEF